MVSIPACHAGDRGSIPRRGGVSFVVSTYIRNKAHPNVSILIAVSFLLPLWNEFFLSSLRPVLLSTPLAMRHLGLAKVPRPGCPWTML